MSRSFHKFGDTAEQILENGYEPLPLAVGVKRPIITEWPSANIHDPDVIAQLVKAYPEAGVGVRCGKLVVIDIDVENPDASHAIRELAIKHFGMTPLIRYGNRPKQALLFQRKGPVFSKKQTAKKSINGTKAHVEVLAAGSQMVAFNIHPNTGQPYSWEDESPLDVPLEDLPAVFEANIDAFLLEAEQLLVSDFGAKNPKKQVKNSSSLSSLAGQPGRFDPAMASSALSVLDSQDRETWIKVGHALKTTDNPDAYGLFLNWSKKRPDGSTPHNFLSDEDVKQTWDSMKPVRTGVGAIYAEAMRNGWQKGPYQLSSATHTAVAKYLLEASQADGAGVVFDEGHLWHYTGSHWQPMSVGEKRGMVHQLDGLQIGNKTISANTNFVSGVLTELYAMSEKEGFFDRAPSGANVKNGFIEIDEVGEIFFHSHNPSFAQRSTLNISWTEDSFLEPSGLLKDYLDSTFGDSADGKQRLALQILGVAATGSSTKLSDPKAFVLFGPSASNGKSQFLELVRCLVPKDVVGNIPPADFSKEQAVAELVGKVANLCDELDAGKTLGSDRFKALVTGDPVSAKIVYQRPFSFTPNAIHIFATNHLPNFSGGVDTGAQRRLISINFERSIPKQKRIPQIAKRILERHGEELLSLAISAASEVFANGGYSIPSIVSRDTDAWFLEADLVRSWIEEGGLESKIFPEGTLVKELYGFFKEDTSDLADTRYQISHRGFTSRLRQALAGHPDFRMGRSNKGQMVFRRRLV